MTPEQARELRAAIVSAVESTLLRYDLDKWEAAFAFDRRNIDNEEVERR